MDILKRTSTSVRGYIPGHSSGPSRGGYNPNKKTITPVVYVSDAGNENVTEYDQTGGSPILTISGLSEPQGIATDNKSNLYIANTETQQVLVYPAGSTTQSQAIATNGYPAGVAVLGNYIYVSNIVNLSGSTPGNFQSFLKNGTPYRSYNCPQALEVFYITANKHGDVFADGFDASDAPAVWEVPQETLTCTQLSIPLNFPGGLAIDNAGNLLVDDQEANTISYAPPSYTAQVASSDIGGTEGLDPVTIALQKGNTSIWTANAGAASATQYTYPGGGTATLTISGSFSEPIGVATWPRGNK
jgi:hypothetical protein